MSILQRLWNNKRFCFVFLFTLSVLVFFGSNLTSYDVVWNYSFSYAISNGQIPFLDFNMIVPGFYNFLMSIGLKTISDSIFIYFVEQALLVTIAFYFLYKMYEKKAWLFLLAMSFPLFIAFSPTYNFGILFLVIIILYLEKNKPNDYLIGLLLGLSIMMKHSIGIFLIIPSIIICFRNLKRLWKRIVGIIIPWIIYLIYLICTGSLYYFIDLCILGMFDFAGENSSFLPAYFIFSIILLVINIYYVIKNSKDIVGYYTLCSFSVMIPIFCHYHFYVYLVFISLLMIEKINLNGNYIKNLSIFSCFILLVFNYSLMIYKYPHTFMNEKNFECVYISESAVDNFMIADDLYNRYKKIGDTEFLSSTTVWLNIANEENLDYFSVLNKGNHGYDGSNKMIRRIKMDGGKYYIINYYEYLQSKRDGGQFDTEVLEYIINNSQLIEEVERYRVYYYE